MPVLLDEKTQEQWLDSKISFEECLVDILASELVNDDVLDFTEVSDLVNSVRNQTPDCILPKKQYDEVKLQKGIGRFFSKETQESKEKKLEKIRESHINYTRR